MKHPFMCKPHFHKHSTFIINGLFLYIREERLLEKEKGKYIYIYISKNGFIQFSVPLVKKEYSLDTIGIEAIFPERRGKIWYLG